MSITQRVCQVVARWVLAFMVIVAPVLFVAGVEQW